MVRPQFLWGSALAVALLLLAGFVVAQTRPTANLQDRLDPPPGSVAAPSSSPAPREKSIDDLVVALEKIRAHKAELDRAEKETTAILREKLRQQRQRLQKLGIADEGSPPLVAPSGINYYPAPPSGALPVPVGPLPTPPSIPKGVGDVVPSPSLAPVAPPQSEAEAPPRQMTN